MKTKKPKLTDKLAEKVQIGALNCHGLEEKIDTPEILNLIEQTDIFGVSETWLKGSREKTSNDMSLPGFSFYPYNRKYVKGSPRGGVGIFVRNEIKTNVKIRYDLSSENVIWCKILKECIWPMICTLVLYISPLNLPQEK